MAAAGTPAPLGLEPPASEPTDLLEEIVLTAEASGGFALPDGAALQRAFAEAADARDDLAELRHDFVFPPTDEGATLRAPGDPTVYLCGNSLGLQPRGTMAEVTAELVKWQQFGVEGHFKPELPWVTVDETPVEPMARVVGALPVEVAVMNSLTVNLHLMMVPFYRPTTDRHAILIEHKAFPSDHHAAASRIVEAGYDPTTALLQVRAREGETMVRTEDVLALLEAEGHRIALVLLPGVQYYTGQLYDIATITAAARAKGCRVGWDLAHAVGNVPLYLHAWGPDFACWCSYKYLNSGPGGIGGCFVHERHAEDATLHRFAGWWGHRKTDRFAMAPDFIASPGAFGFQLSNPSVLCIAALRASLAVFDRAGGMERLRRKSLAVTGYLERLLRVRLPQVRIMTSSDIHQRGAQLSIEFPPEVPLRDVYNSLTREGVIVDIREPSAMRVAPAPLYNSFQDVWWFVDTLVRVLAQVPPPV